jgi:hypothetical protein
VIEVNAGSTPALGVFLQKYKKVLAIRKIYGTMPEISGEVLSLSALN